MKLAANVEDPYYTLELQNLVKTATVLQSVQDIQQLRTGTGVVFYDFVPGHRLNGHTLRESDFDPLSTFFGIWHQRARGIMCFIIFTV